MKRIGLAILAAAALGLTMPLETAGQQPSAPKTAAAAPKIGKDEKVCRHTFPGGEKRTWVCKIEEPCCAWDAIKYVKCGSTVFKCL